MNEDLRYTYNNISDWLKFAEAKNAGLLALNIACVIGIIQGEQVFGNDMKAFEALLISLFSISSCFCLYTILPVVNKGFRFYKKMDDQIFINSLDNLNALYFKDIATLSSDQFVKLFEHKHNCTLTKAEKDFGNQITNNAEICVQKYSLFMAASWFSFGTFVTTIMLVIIKSIS